MKTQIVNALIYISLKLYKGVPKFFCFVKLLKISNTDHTLWATLFIDWQIRLDINK